jgi:hypothetical protein
VEKILDPASSYEVETPTGVAGVRGSVMVVSVGEDGTTWVTNREGNIYANAHGEEVDVPVDQTCIIMPDQRPNLMPVAEDDIAGTNEHTSVVIDVLNNDYDPDDSDTLIVDSVTQGAHGYVTNNYGQNVTYSPVLGFNGIDNFTYTVSDGDGGTDTANVRVNVHETSARIKVTSQPGAVILIWDDTLDEWAKDKDTGEPVDGTNHETTDTITVAGGRYYYVWVDSTYCVYYVESYPDGWSIKPALEGDDWAAYGYLVADTLVSVSFAGECSY